MIIAHQDACHIAASITFPTTFRNSLLTHSCPLPWARLPGGKKLMVSLPSLRSLPLKFSASAAGEIPGPSCMLQLRCPTFCPPTPPIILVHKPAQEGKDPCCDLSHLSARGTGSLLWPLTLEYVLRAICAVREAGKTCFTLWTAPPVADARK